MGKDIRSWLDSLSNQILSTRELVLSYIVEKTKEAYERDDLSLLPGRKNICSVCPDSGHMMYALSRLGHIRTIKVGNVFKWIATKEGMDWVNRDVRSRDKKLIQPSSWKKVARTR